MTLNIITIVLDGMPFIQHHLPQLERLTTPWKWVIVEGVAKPVGCTQWCKPIPPRLSEDGTHEYLETLKGHPHVTVVSRPEWNGKLEMFNTAVQYLMEPGSLLQMDSDELWTTKQFERIAGLFRARTNLGKAYFFCRYFVGPDIVTVGDNCYGNNRDFEWLRAWRYEPGMEFQRHERPIFNFNKGLTMGRHETKGVGLVFDHMAYATEAQVRFKETYYGYAGAVEQWRRLQANQQWPVRRLKDFLPWVDKVVGATRLCA